MQKNKLKIAISGALGRMGKILIQEIIQHTDVYLTAAIIRKNDLFIKKDIGTVLNMNPIGININHSIQNEINSFDILIDFSTVKNTINNLKICQKHNKNMVIGTTGFNEIEKKIIKLASKNIGIVYSENFSIGINLILKLLEQTTNTLSHDSDIEIIDVHHKDKIDAPSGTALLLGQKIAQTMNVNLEEYSIYRKKGCIGKREKQKIGFSIVRAGDVVGEHTIIFAKLGERVEISHKISNRTPFAKGAINAAIWLNTDKKGLFTMQDVLNF
ncbi:4-hydroxy-tetrahydrodipicolinate reductase [Buchnera aphidicola (Formosaphis micheliae)]|uniref:4-hydroxy-tetrahydrodipicolinate reductase n=1 Tax=Buchnera aphidicola TaxID=9 RepID=UPI0031CC5045